MRKLLPVTMFAVLAGLAALPGQAQFQAPTQEELKMTAEPSAPGADAIYLNYDEKTDDKLHSKHLYVRIKVLTEKGKELATVEPWYYGDFKVEDIKGRTIHTDGTIIPLTGKPEELLVSKVGESKLNKKVFTLPSVEVGSILEYDYAIRYEDNMVSSPRWEIQKKYFVRKAHYHFTPSPIFLKGAEQRQNMTISNSKGTASSLIWASNLPPGVKLREDPSGRFDLDLTDVPALPQEDWMPPMDSTAYYLLYYYSPAYNQKDFWVNESKDWSRQVTKFTEPTPALSAAVQALVAPTDTELEKAKKLYKAVQDLDNTDFSRSKGQTERKMLKLGEVKKAEDVWKQKSGDSNQIAQLYLALLRAAGITSLDMRVVNRNYHSLNWQKLDFDQFDDDIVVVTLDGKQMMLDPGQKMCPFGLLHWKHGATPGVGQSLQGATIGTAADPYYLDNKEIRRGVITINELGEATGTIDYTLLGNGALAWRQSALRNDMDDLKKSFDEYLADLIPEGMEGHVDHFLGMDDPNANLIAVVKVQGALGTSTAKRMILPGMFLATHGQHPFVERDKRVTPIDMQYGKQVTDEITYKLPAGFTLEGGITDTSFTWPNHASMVIKSKVTPTSVVVARQVSRAFSVLKPEEYQELRGFYQKVAEADQQTIVLNRAAPASGN